VYINCVINSLETPSPGEYRVAGNRLLLYGKIKMFDKIHETLAFQNNRYLATNNTDP
jgi:hypothetical protein